MKKTVLSLIFGIFCVVTTFAQISVLPKVGLNLSNVQYKSNHATDGRRGVVAGLTLGAEVNAKLAGPLSFQTGLLYSGKGWGGREELSGRYRLNYLEIPLMGRATVDAGPVGIYVNGGFGLGYLLSGHIKGDIGFGGLRAEVDEKIKFDAKADEPYEMDANRLDLGLLVGGGVNYELTANTRAFLDLRYNHGLTDFDREEISKHRTFTIALGMEFSL